jgi:hypothetical protein
MCHCRPRRKPSEWFASKRGQHFYTSGLRTIGIAVEGVSNVDSFNALWKYPILATQENLPLLFDRGLHARP